MNITELVNWNYEQKCRKAVQALEKNGFTAIYCPAKQQAADYILQEARDAQTVGFGGSMSVAGLAVAEKLAEMGKELLIHGKPGLKPEEVLNIMRRQLTSDLFLAGTGALTLSGCLVNIDMTGNRVGSMFFGPKKVIVVAGRNKIVDNVEEAVKRIKRYAAPPNAKRLNKNTPCAKTGFCHDCNSPDRICRIMTVVERKPPLTDLRILVVNEDMGL
ncbi:lactate utilization protein [Desulfallas sp. Bu1-1]|uniref:lactate utilization protein n=1 Tax=Desulfallas sp. Bu1-1 TaxID=2787620 RepID=UPI0018A0E466|nr:lactate utilization protein [Desulfallas sp. Bu1-1]MBF7081515.1 lactate utilization protein [Desulfallas sp. Bu1-1]